MKKALIIILAVIVAAAAAVGTIAVLRHRASPKAGTADVSAASGTDAVEANEEINRYDPANALAVWSTNTLIAVTQDGAILYDSVSEDAAQLLAKTSSWKNVVSVTATGREILGLTRDGSLYALSMRAGDEPSYPADEWSRIVKLAAFAYADTVKGRVTAALKADGTVVCSGIALGDAAEWTDVVDIACAKGLLLGLRRDGTVVAAGVGAEGATEVDGWTGIAAIRAFEGLAVGIGADGSLHAAGRAQLTEKLAGYANVKDVVGRTDFVLLLDDGTVRATDDGKARTVARWTDLKSIRLTGSRVAGLKNDGTVVYADDVFASGALGDASEASSWTDVTAVCGNSFLACVTSDGRVLATEGVLGSETFRLNTDGWDLLPGVDPAQTSAAEAARTDAPSHINVEEFTLRFGRYEANDGFSSIRLNADGTFEREFAGAPGDSGTWAVRTTELDGDFFELTFADGTTETYQAAGNDVFGTAWRATTVYTYAGE